MGRQYMVGHPPHRGGADRRTTHIVARTLEYLPDGYATVCSSTKRGLLVDGPAPETPLCKRCHDMTTPGVVRRQRRKEMHRAG